MRITLVCLLLALAAPAFAGGLLEWPPIILGPPIETNGGFEEGEDPWGFRSAFTLSTDAHTGSYSAMAVDLGSVANTNTINQTIPVQAGKFYRLSFWIKMDNINGEKVGSGIRGSFTCSGGGSVTAVLSGTSDWQYVEQQNIFFPEDCNAKISIGEYRAPVMGTVWIDDVRLIEEEPPNVSATIIRPSYRSIIWSDMPQEATFEVGGDGPLEAVVVYSDNGQTINTPVSAGLVTLPLNRTAVVSFRELGGPTLGYPQYLVEHRPASERASAEITWLDDQRFRINDQKRFLLFVYDSGIGYTNSESGWVNIFDNTRRLNELSPHINGYINYHFGKAPATAMHAMMNVLWSRGILYWQTANCFSSSYRRDFLMLADQAYAESLGANPGYAGVYIADECRITLADDVYDEHTKVKEWVPLGADLIVNNKSLELGAWYDSGDVIGPDAYPMPGAEPPEGYDFGLVARYAQRANEATRERPFHVVLPFFKHFSAGRFPTEKELLNMSYMSIVEGAQGLGFWSIGNGSGAMAIQFCSNGSWCPEKEELYSRLVGAIQKISALESVLVAPDDTTSLVSVSPEIKAIVRSGHIIAYNTTNTPVTATFEWIDGQSFTLDFGPFEGRVHEVDGEIAPPLAPSNITVEVN
jgi:hypothetical protein